MLIHKNMHSLKQKAFTLVELIVVITILAILGTIGFLSLLGYQVKARDSVRLSDMGNITKVVSLSRLRDGNFPVINNPINITFSGSNIWQQGSFGEAGYKSSRRLSQLPLDPLTGNEYAYSITYKTAEFQVGGILEGAGYSFLETPNEFILPQTNAAVNVDLPSDFSGFSRGNLMENL